MKEEGDKFFSSLLRKQGMKRVLSGKTTLKELKRISMNTGRQD
jgi:hypothetical protein